MDEKSDQIIGHIEAQRDELGRNLNELETRVRAGTNWRTYYDRNPMLAVGAALGGGLILGTVVSSGVRSSSRAHRPSHAGQQARPSSSARSARVSSTSTGTSAASSLVSSPVTTMQRRQISETFDHIKAALIAFGIAKAKEFLNQAIPGLERHLTEAEQRGRQHSKPTSPESWQTPGSPQPTRPEGPHSWESAGASSHPDTAPAI